MNKGILERLGQRYYPVDIGQLRGLVQLTVDMQYVVVTQSQPYIKTKQFNHKLHNNSCGQNS